MKILIAEDDFLIAQNISNALKFIGYQILGPYQTGEEAIAISNNESLDLAILDLQLKDSTSGLEVGKHLKKTQNCPFILITANSNKEIITQAKDLQVAAFLNKPFHERNLLNAIDLALCEKAKTSKAAGSEAFEKSVSYSILDKIYLKKNERYIRIFIKDILFLEASGHYVIIQTDKEQIMANNNLSALLAEINHPDLLKIHRSFAVNIKNIPDFDDAFIYYPQKAVPISRNGKPLLKEKLKLI